MGIETLAIAGLVASVASAGMGAIGSMQQSQAQASAARYQAAVAENARTVAEWQAKDAEKRGLIAEEQRRTKTRLQIGAQRSALASMGADINDGSNLDIIGDTAAVGEQDALTIRSNYAREAWDKRVAATTYAGDAALAKSNAANFDGNSWIGVGANLIAGASSVADKWSVYKSKGILS